MTKHFLSILFALILFCNNAKSAEYKIYINEDNDFQEYVNDEVLSMPYSERQKLKDSDIDILYFQYASALMHSQHLNRKNQEYTETTRNEYSVVIYIDENTPKTFTGNVKITHGAKNISFIDMKKFLNQKGKRKSLIFGDFETFKKNMNYDE